VSLTFALLGHPVAHSLSPAIHRAAYHELGLPHRYDLIDAVDEATFAAALAELGAGRIAGANVTIPWKRQALALADRADPSASDVGAANVLCRTVPGEVVAHNTDVPALALEIGAAAPGVSRGLVLGNGGAALAAVAALKRLGARTIAVSARRFALAEPRAEWPHAAGFERLGAVLVPWPGAGSSELADFAAQAQVIVQATSAGMHGAEPGAGVAEVIPWERLGASMFAYDLVYNPAETEFIRRARAQGCSVAGGLGMLVGQAALAFELWLGVRPPLEAMRRAAEAELARRGP
jgi:shikimate dehydrogenase